MNIKQLQIPCVECIAYAMCRGRLISELDNYSHSVLKQRTTEVIYRAFVKILINQCEIIKHDYGKHIKYVVREVNDFLKQQPKYRNQKRHTFTASKLTYIYKVAEDQIADCLYDSYIKDTKYEEYKIS